MAGIEPASGRLTAAYPYQHGSHRNEPSGRPDWSRRSRAPATMLCTVPGGMPGFPTSSIKSAQRELNPHFRHGKAAGYRYIMGASNRWSNCQRSEHRVGLEPTSPHYGCGVLAAGRPVPFVQVGSEGLEPSPTWLRARHAAASTLIPCSDFFTRAEWARRESNPQSDPYKRPALTVELRAVNVSGAEGI